MANPWFRLYHEWDSDPKVQSMPEVMQRRLVMLFCSKCRGESLRDPDRAFHWRISLGELAETKALFTEKGFIEGDWELVNWNQRQFLSDSSTERVRRYREKMRETHETQCNISDSLHTDGSKPINIRLETVRNVTVTAPDTDTEAETESKAEKKQRPSRAKKPREVPAKPPKEARPPTKTDIADARHALFKAAILGYWQSKNQDAEMPWDAAEGKQLAMWLKAAPNTTLPQFTAYLRNRFRSDVNHSERPSRWIGNITGYAAGPLDKFSKPANGGTNSNGKFERVTQTGIEALDLKRRMASEPNFIGRTLEAGTGTDVGGEGTDAPPVGASLH